MSKIIIKFLLFLFLLILISITFLSTVGFETERFNSKISDQVKKIDRNLDIKLNKVKIILDPFKLKIRAKTLGTDLIYNDKSIQLENIKTNISLKSLIKGNFLLKGLSISTKSLEIKNLISFVRSINKNPKIYIVEQFIEDGLIIANIKIEFDEKGNIKNNYEINGVVKKGNINLLKKLNLKKIDLAFNIQKNNFLFTELNFFLNKNNLSIPKMTVIQRDKKFLVSGKISNKNTTLTKKDLIIYLDKNLTSFDIQEIIFSSENDFSFHLNKKLKLKDLKILSNVDLKKLRFKNSLELNKFFPKIKDNILLKDHKIEIKYDKDSLIINGLGETFFQENSDKLKYKFLKNKNEIIFSTNLSISKNLFKLDLLDYQKSQNSKLEIDIEGKKKFKGNLLIKNLMIKEKNNIFSIKDLVLLNDNKIDDFKSVTLNYLDQDNLENKINIKKINNDYSLKGISFNINKIIEKILEPNTKKKLSIFNSNFRLNFDIKKIYFDENHITKNLSGYLFLKNNSISELNLKSKFKDNKDIKLTIKTNGDEKITTLFSNEAKPLVDRYKFIKGFNEGSLDFYSIKKNDKTKSAIKIYDFKLKELPALTKLLTLASLQGIADLLSGEGIRFNEFEMNFTNEGKLMTIDEIYAIGPAISILMEGYIEKDNLISLRGTLVPATTINKTISSIPILGSILVGEKVGEGVFGVSFKIKGPPKKLETSVNPIKTLTPRFITRTLEKIKQN